MDAAHQVGGSKNDMQTNHRRAYAVVNASTMPLWLAMLLAPRSRVTAWLVDRASALLLTLGVGYTAMLGAGIARSGTRPDFRDPAAVQAAFGQPEVFLAGWTHYVAFDFFVGRWIWSDALARGRPARWTLLLTLFAGPAGLSAYLARRG